MHLVVHPRWKQTWPLGWVYPIKRWKLTGWPVGLGLGNDKTTIIMIKNL